MAKKTAPATPAAEPMPASTPEEPAVSLSRAIREALKAEGVRAPVGDVEMWIKRTYPNLQFSRQTLSSTLSTQRKKMQEEMGLLPTKSGSAGERGGPTVDDLMRVKHMASSRGGVEELMSLVQKVEDVAKEVGGLEKLKKSLDTLKTLTS
jgi:hypothetical protein